MPISFESYNYDLILGTGNFIFDQTQYTKINGNINIDGIVSVSSTYNLSRNYFLSVNGNLNIQKSKLVGSLTTGYLEYGTTYNTVSNINSSYINFHNKNYLNQDVIGGNIIALNGYSNTNSYLNALYLKFKNIFFISSLQKTLKSVRINCVPPFLGDSGYYLADPYILDIFSTVRTKNVCMKKLYIQTVNVSYKPINSLIIDNDGTNVYFTSANNSTYSLNNGYFGIICNPSYTLDVNGVIQNNGGLTISNGIIRIFQGNSTTTGYIRLIQNGSTFNIGNFNSDATNVYINATATSRNLSFFTNNTRRMTVLSNNNYIGIGVTPTTYQLQLSTDSAAKLNSSYWTTPSDMRLKEDIELADISLCYSVVKNLKLKRWKWRDDIDPTFSAENLGDRHKLGWIAQDVSNIIPKAVEHQDIYGISDCLSLNPDQIYISLYGCVEKIIEDKEQLEQTVFDLQTKIDGLKTKIQLYKTKKNIS
jgi:hypothetical protein